MKKPTVLFSLLAVAALVLAACGGVGTPAPPSGEGEVRPASEIVVYNWSNYVDPEIYTLFEQEFGIKVVEEHFSSNEELLAKIRSGATGYAVIIPSDYTVGIMVAEGMLAKLDRANIYCSPYQWGTTGIGYLDGEVDPPTSWSVIFEPDPASPAYGRMTMVDDPREVFAAALIYLGYSVNTTDQGQLQEARDLLIQAKAGLAGYDSDTYTDLLVSGENLLAHGWNGDFLMARDENENIVFTIPEEGGVVFVDNMCIPLSATPEEKLAGEMLINFVLRPEIGARLSQYIYYASPNQAAEQYLGPEFLSDPVIYPPIEVMAKLQYLEPVGEAESLYQRLWDEVKSAP
ncbi:MAG: polyamine ABC transporter substrate-binding protein [Chloroflexota bacterium]